MSQCYMSPCYKPNHLRSPLHTYSFEYLGQSTHGGSYFTSGTLSTLLYTLVLPTNLSTTPTAGPLSVFIAIASWDNTNRNHKALAVASRVQYIIVRYNWPTGHGSVRLMECIHSLLEGFKQYPLELIISFTLIIVKNRHE